MEDEIKPIVDKLNKKGYKVKYASPGHNKLRKKKIKNLMVSTMDIFIQMQESCLKKITILKQPQMDGIGD